MSDDRPRAVCVTCQRGLYVVTSMEGVSYVHGPRDPDDHEVIPVKPGPEWRSECDFCTGPHPEWVLPVRDFRMPHNPELTSYGSWLACSSCARLIVLDQWAELVRLAVKRFVDQHGHGILPDNLYPDFYRVIRENVTGPLHRLGDGS